MRCTGCTNTTSRSRLDATHEPPRRQSAPLLAELTARVRGSAPGRDLLLIAEDHRNLAKMVQPESSGGWNLDGVWADDFHPRFRRFLAGDHEGSTAIFTRSDPRPGETINQGWYYHGQHSIHLDEAIGTDPQGVAPTLVRDLPPESRPVGNRAFGDRLNMQIGPAAYRAASNLLLTAPETPLLFMGQEWAADSPFLYFTDHERTWEKS